MSDINTNININNKVLQPKNYIIDGDIDGTVEDNFFSKLKNMLNEHNNDDDYDADADNYCLLTKETLGRVHIKLACGHKFNYVPLYREVVMQKITGMSSNGYYQTHSLKRNEIKCPYCRTVQDKLLPYLEYDGVNKTMGVNHPKTLSMSVETCGHVDNKKSKKKLSSSCKENAMQLLNGVYLCKKHYDHATATTAPVTSSSSCENDDNLAAASGSGSCGVILRYGKNKGKPCSNSSKCRIHLAQNKNISIV